MEDQCLTGSASRKPRLVGGEKGRVLSGRNSQTILGLDDFTLVAGIPV